MPLQHMAHDNIASIRLVRPWCHERISFPAPITQHYKRHSASVLPVRDVHVILPPAAPMALMPSGGSHSGDWRMARIGMTANAETLEEIEVCNNMAVEWYNLKYCDSMTMMLAVQVRCLCINLCLCIDYQNVFVRFVSRARPVTLRR